MTDFSATEFQARCRESLVKTLDESLVKYSFEYVQGKGDNYFVYDLAMEVSQIKVYVYSDEAGFFVGDKWFALKRRIIPLRRH